MARKKIEEPSNLFNELLSLRDEQRARLKTALKVVKGEERSLERNQMGLYRWYLHPSLKDRALNTLMLWVQEIPPGSCSGKQHHQGGRIHMVVEGRGYTVVDGVKHEWEKWDVIYLPIKPEGVVFQHFNSDPERPAKLVAAEPNLVDALGLDLGIDFEQLENSPDYHPAGGSP